MDTANFQYIFEPSISGFIVGFDEASGFFIVDCDRICELPTIVFVFNGKPIKLYGEDYVIVYDGPDGPECYLDVYPLDIEAGSWLVGDPFLAAYYAKYDMENYQISFAQSINQRKCRRSCPKKKEHCKDSDDRNLNKKKWKSGYHWEI